MISTSSTPHFSSVIAIELASKTAGMWFSVWICAGIEGDLGGGRDELVCS